MIESLGLKRLPSSSSPPDPTSCVNRGLIKFTAGKREPYVPSLLMQKGPRLVKHTRPLLSSSVRTLLSCVAPLSRFRLQIKEHVVVLTHARYDATADGLPRFARRFSGTFFSLLYGHFILFFFIAAEYSNIARYPQVRKREREKETEKKGSKESNSLS